VVIRQGGKSYSEPIFIFISCSRKKLVYRSSSLKWVCCNAEILHAEIYMNQIFQSVIFILDSATINRNM